MKILIKQFITNFELFIIRITFNRNTQLLIAAIYFAFFITYFTSILFNFTSILLNLEDLVNLNDNIQVIECDNQPIKDECIPIVESSYNIDKSESESKKELNNNNDEFKLLSYKNVIIATAVVLILVGIYFYMKPKDGNIDDYESETAATYGGSSSTSNSYIIATAGENTIVVEDTQSAVSNLLDIERCFSVPTLRGAYINIYSGNANIVDLKQF